MKTDNMFGVAVSRDELRGIIIRRNELAFHLNSRRLPPTLKNDKRTCQWCHQLDNCTLYHKVDFNDSRFFTFVRLLRMAQRNRVEWVIFLRKRQCI